MTTQFIAVLAALAAILAAMYVPPAHRGYGEVEVEVEVQRRPVERR